MKISAVIFDLGNVLIQYDTGIFINGFMKLSGKSHREVVDAFLAAYSGRFDTGESTPELFYNELNSKLDLNVSFEDFKKVYSDIFFERK
jgi:FMN phosphatase YigB (HAD superfamily)